MSGIVLAHLLLPMPMILSEDERKWLDQEQTDEDLKKML
jgi:hypothetical protein